MLAGSHPLDLVSGTLEYPGETSADFARAAALELAAQGSPLAPAVDGLAAFLETAEPGEPEERYTALFDLSPVCTLHVGFHLFGEAYQRGEVLVGLAQEMRKADVELRGDLPDYLPTVLRLVARLPEGGERASLVDALLLPALVRMNEALGESVSPWADVVRTLPAALLPLGGGDPLPPPPRPVEVLQEAELA